MKTLLVTMRLQVEDLPDDQLQKLAADMDVPLTDLDDGRLAALSAEGIAGQLNGCIVGAYPGGIASEGANEMLFEGSDLYIRFVTAEIVSAAWEGES